MCVVKEIRKSAWKIRCYIKQPFSLDWICGTQPIVWNWIWHNSVTFQCLNVLEKNSRAHWWHKRWSWQWRNLKNSMKKKRHCIQQPYFGGVLHGPKSWNDIAQLVSNVRKCWKCFVNYIDDICDESQKI